jgi:hypothetical protein
MTTATDRPVISPAQLERATAMAARLLAAHRLGKILPVAAKSFGRAIAITPPRSEHGQLLARALRPPDGTARPEDVQAAVRLACEGTTPTARAVAACLDGARQHRASASKDRAAVAEIAARDGQRAAACVAEVVARTGQGPTWHELGHELGPGA